MKLLVIETGSGKMDMFLMHMIGNLATHRRTYHGAFFFSFPLDPESDSNPRVIPRQASARDVSLLELETTAARK